MALYEHEPATLKGINAHYASRIAPSLDEMEAARRKALSNGWWNLGGFTAVSLAVAYLVYTRYPQVNPLIIVVAFVIGVFIAYTLAMWRAKAVKTDHKHLVVREIAAFMGYAYRPSGIYDMVLEFSRIGLLPAYDRAGTEDGLSGEVDGVQFQLTEATLTKRRRTGKNTGIVTVFKGVLVSMGYPKRFRGRTVILRDQGAFGNWLRDLISGMERVSIDHPAFARRFEVYSTNGPESRALLTTEVADRLLRVSEVTKGLVVAFDRRAVHLAHRPGDLMEVGGLRADLTDPALTRRVVEELSTIRLLAEMLAVDGAGEGEPAKTAGEA